MAIYAQSQFTRVVIYLSWWCIMRVVFQQNNCMQNVSKWFVCLPNGELSADKYHSIGFNDLHVSVSFSMKEKQTTHTLNSIPLSLLFHWFVSMSFEIHEIFSMETGHREHKFEHFGDSNFSFFKRYPFSLLVQWLLCWHPTKWKNKTYNKKQLIIDLCAFSNIIAIFCD